MSERAEVELGQSMHQSIVRSVGVVEEPALRAYVTAVGQRIVDSGERPDLAWSFTILDDPAVNAFALPGGFVYVARGLLAYLNDEAELAAAIGHEIGHVTARHGVDQYRRAQRAERGVGLLRIIDPQLRHVGGVMAGAAQLTLLHHSRQDELEADDLAIRYLGKATYPRGALLDVLQILGSLEAHQEGAQVPTWLSTHPALQERVQRLSALARERGTASERRREEYLSRLEGLVFGNDPRGGVVLENTFYWPERNIQVTLPPQWKSFVGKGEIAALSPDEKAFFVLTAVGSSDPKEVERRLFENGDLQPVRHEAATIAALPARIIEFRATSEGDALSGLIAIMDHPKGVVALLSVARAQAWTLHADAIMAVLRSGSAIDDAAVRDVEPARLELLRLGQPRSLRDLWAEQPGSAPAETMVAINRIELDEALPEGFVVKWVRGGLTGNRAQTHRAPTSGP